MTLQEIGFKHQTDKGTAHHYLELYDLLFSKWRNHRVHLLEIGLQFGNSAKTWLEYFPQGNITMIDAVNNHVNPGEVTILIGNAYEDAMLKRLLPPYDILIDDGNHSLPSQEFFVEHYLPMLRADGIGIVEDVYCRAFALRLEKLLPSGFTSTTVEMSKGASLVDSRLFIAWRSI